MHPTSDSNRPKEGRRLRKEEEEMNVPLRWEDKLLPLPPE
jgi:hypothetical protein